MDRADTASEPRVRGWDRMRASVSWMNRALRASVNTASCSAGVPPPLPTIATTRILLPPAAIVNGEVKQVSLEEYKDKYVILFFYPKDFT